MSIGEHLDELRGCIVRSLYALVLAGLLCAWPAQYVLAWTVQPLELALRRHGQPQSLLATSPTEPLVWYIKVVLFMALVVAGPYVIYQLWTFVAKGLYRKEREWVYRLIPFSAGLFVGGVLFMYAFVLFLSLDFLIGFGSWLTLPVAEPTTIQQLLIGQGEPEVSPAAPGADGGAATAPAFPSALHAVPSLRRDPNGAAPGALWFNASEQKLKLQGDGQTYSVQFQRDDRHVLVTTHMKIGDYLNFVLVLAIAFGLAFQVPLVVLFLTRTGIAPRETLARYRKVVILIIVIIAGMLAPPDLLSHLLLSVPMILLFELGLLLSRPKPAPM